MRTMNRISNLISGIYLMLVRKYYTGSASNRILSSWISKQKHITTNTQQPISFNVLFHYILTSLLLIFFPRKQTPQKAPHQGKDAIGRAIHDGTFIKEGKYRGKEDHHEQEGIKPVP